jgi:formate-dependent phosphoribosylglycinamide formyltransferase (GAR transformylase)
MKNLISQFEKTGKVNTHYFNGYGFTNKTKEVKEALINLGYKFYVKNIMGSKTRTQIIAI